MPTLYTSFDAVTDPVVVTFTSEDDPDQQASFVYFLMNDAGAVDPALGFFSPVPFQVDDGNADFYINFSGQDFEFYASAPGNPFAFGTGGAFADAPIYPYTGRRG